MDTRQNIMENSEGSAVTQSGETTAGAFLTEETLISYFKRINYSGSRNSSLETLKSIHLLHPQAIAFENLNPLFRIPVELDLKSIQQKLIHEKRGGYCFEHNLLLKAVLQTIGFKVIGLAARVQWNTPEHIITPRGHMLLLVEAEGESYIADVGFGGNTLTAPLSLKAEEVQETPHGKYRLVMVGDEYQLQAEVKGIWRPLYKFGLQEHLLPDYEASSWYLSNHPESHFVTSLVAARVEKDKRYALRNNQLVIHHNTAHSEKLELKNALEIKEVFLRYFGIQVPVTPQSEEILAKVIDGAIDK